MAKGIADIDHLLKLTLDPQKIEATLCVDAQADPRYVTTEAIEAYLTGRDLRHKYIDQKAIETLVAQVASDPTSSHSMMIAKGEPPVEGSDAYIELDPIFESKFQRIREREHALLESQQDPSEEHDLFTDFYNISAFVLASKGDRIARFHPHTLGSDGTSVMGISIAAKPGRAIEHPCDNSCKLTSDSEIIAVQSGVLLNLDNCLSIEENLVVKGAVDFSVGNIEYPGDVQVMKGVKDNFKIKTAGSIEVHNLVEAAHLDSDSDTMLHQGMAGRESGTLSVAGNLQAGYLDAVEATVLGNCQISKELTNCTVQIAGLLDAEHAAVRGGTISLSRGGTIHRLGSIQGVRTEVVVAKHEDIQEKILRVQSMIPRLQSEIVNRTKELDTLRQNIAKPNPEQATEICFMESNIGALHEKSGHLELSLKRLFQILAQLTDPTLRITGTLFAKSELWLPGYHAVFSRDLEGELSITLNKEREPIIIRGSQTQPLSDYATIRPDQRVIQIPITDADEQMLQQAA